MPMVLRLLLFSVRSHCPEGAASNSVVSKPAFVDAGACTYDTSTCEMVPLQGNIRDFM